MRSFTWIVSWPVVDVYASECFWWENEQRFVPNLVFVDPLVMVIQTEPTRQFLKTLSNPLLFDFTFFNFYHQVKFSICYIMCICLDHSFFNHTFLQSLRFLGSNMICFFKDRRHQSGLGKKIAFVSIFTYLSSFPLDSAFPYLCDFFTGIVFALHDLIFYLSCEFITMQFNALDL